MTSIVQNGECFMTAYSSSIWLRWDPHIHTPGTALNDQFNGDWDSYIESIENSDPPVKVLGITDYCSINSYEEFRQYYKDGRAPNLDFIVPNIEFRLMPRTIKAYPLNIHILVSPHDHDHIDRCKEALSRLTTKVANEETIPCDKNGREKVLEDKPNHQIMDSKERDISFYQ